MVFIIILTNIIDELILFIIIIHDRNRLINNDNGPIDNMIYFYYYSL